MKLKNFFKKAQKNKWALGQFNFSSFAQLKGIIRAASKLKSPLVLGTSEGESNFLGLEITVVLRDAFRNRAGVPCFLNLDHGRSVDFVKKACKIGYDMVHFDGSRLELEENIEKTKEVVKYARKHKVLVEGEVGTLGTESSKIYKEKFEIKEENLTDPREAARFVKETKVDLLASNVGSFHGLSVKEKNPHILIDRLKKIKKETGNKLLVLHGGSGTPEEDIREAINNGVVKINVNTELRVAFTETLKKSFKEDPEQIVPYKYLPQAVNAVQKVVEEKIKLFGSQNKI